MAAMTDGAAVLQCNKCRSIVADTYAWVSTDEDLKTVSVRAAPGVKIISEFNTAREGADKGSSYMPLACNFCDARLGLVYQTTPQALDHLREQFTFYTDSISSYQLGTGLEDAPLPQGSSTQANAALLSEVTEIQKVVLVLSERLDEHDTKIDQLLSQKRPRTS